MIELNLVQGSPEWLAHRAKYRNASDTPCVTGSSSYKSRSDFLKERATGIATEVDAATQRRFDDGHKFEALARPLMEKIIGEDLFPVVGVDGLYSASFDGLTMMGDTNAEHKTLNDAIRACVTASSLPPMYREQMEHQMMVSGASRSLFMATKWKIDGNGEYVLEEEKHFWYEPDSEIRMKICAAWKQFAIDVANYQHVETVAPAVAAVVKGLPAVLVKVSGQVSIIDNFSLFETALRDFIDNRLVRKPQNDQDFADLGEQIASLKKAEAALDAAEVQMLSQVESVDAMKRTKDMLHKLARDNRLVAEKLLAAEKESRKAEIVRAGADALVAHVLALSERIGQPMPAFFSNFGGVIKGLKSLDSMRSNVADELARMKIETNATADRIEANKKTVEDMSLFPDFSAVCTKAPEDFAALLAMRVGQRKEAEEKRLEAERAKIRAEEQAKAQLEANAKAAEECAVQAKEAADAQKAIDDATAEAKRAADAVAAQELRELAAQLATAQAAEYAEQQKAVSVPVIAVEQPDPVLAAKWIADLNALTSEMTDNEGARLVHYARRLIAERQVAA